MAFAPPAERVPPVRVARMSHREGHPSAATIIGGTVVIRRSSIMRGLVKAK
jgi:hypothetical protein